MRLQLVVRIIELHENHSLHILNREPARRTADIDTPSPLVLAVRP
jgi:hypothetical protein